jgi:transcriptional regulator GlxA family with amidase domain
MVTFRKNQATASPSAKARRRRRPHRVAVLARDGVMPMELGLVHQLFRSATTADGLPLYDVQTCTLTPGLVRTDADFSVRVEHGPQDPATADAVVVPASHETDETGILTPALADALSRIRRTSRVASICTGAFVLAAAGMLDGRSATTHWKSADRFRALFPSVDLEPEVLYTDEGRVLTAAGEASGIDLCLHIIRCDHGAGVANRVARATVVSPHREGGQAQFIEQPVPATGDTSTAAARAWALRNLGEPVSLQQMAGQASMSVRTFTRRFRAELGLSPGQWLTRQRVYRARHLLEETDLPVDTVAARAGFGTGASMRTHFNQALGISPKSYRDTFRAPATPDAASRG